MSITRTRALVGVALALLASAPATAASAQGAVRYHVARRFAVGGDGGWDYLAVDTARHRLFVARSDRMMVLDEATGKLLGEIPGLQRGHGVAFAYGAGHGFITSGADSSVVMFDLATLQVIRRTTAAVDADAVLFDPASTHVFTFNGDANSASVIDANLGSKIGDIPLGGKPEFGVTDGAGHIWVNLEDSAQVVEIDSRAARVVRRWSIAPCEEPSGLALDAVHHRLFSVCGNRRMAISDAQQGRLATTVTIGNGPDAAAYDSATGLAFSTNGEGTLTVVRRTAAGKYVVAQTVSTMRGARTMALDPVSHRLYTASARFGPVPAAATPDNPRRRPPILPGTFTVLVLER